MAKLPGRKRGRALSRLAVAAVAAALVGTSASAAVADAPVPAPMKNLDMNKLAQAAPKAGAGAHAKARATVRARTQSATPVFGMFGVERSSGFLYQYVLDGRGGFDERTFVTGNWDLFRAAAPVDNDDNGDRDGMWAWDNAGNLYFNSATEHRTVGGGWNIYDKVLSPGNLGGGGAYDILARDKSGVLWLYLGYNNGQVDPRVKIGAGWGGYTQIAGAGDLTGDGKADIVARDGSGVLWLYKGTGNYKAPFSSRVKIGAGWNGYNALVGTGDVDLDGRADLVARGNDGKLWLYKGTGNASAPFAPRKQLGFGYNIYSWMF
ncbi:FG-GAP repeat domain-containing protein [Streptomyces chrestomyceticus]|uniref:FG-GAP repeat domain-containing protein n=1 Tax=Streptomyces chrestomyceticus TaxID=68185 RepID=UPI000F61B15F|nr:VCBS repeat-containing protein [Streptomyces chrestomyceticus]